MSSHNRCEAMQGESTCSQSHADIGLASLSPYKLEQYHKVLRALKEKYVVSTRGPLDSAETGINHAGVVLGGLSEAFPYRQHIEHPRVARAVDDQGPDCFSQCATPQRGPRTIQTTARVQGVGDAARRYPGQHLSVKDVSHKSTGQKLPCPLTSPTTNFEDPELELEPWMFDNDIDEQLLSDAISNDCNPGRDSSDISNTVGTPGSMGPLVEPSDKCESSPWGLSNGPDITGSPVPSPIIGTNTTEKTFQPQHDMNNMTKIADAKSTSTDTAVPRPQYVQSTMPGQLKTSTQSKTSTQPKVVPQSKTSTQSKVVPQSKTSTQPRVSTQLKMPTQSKTSTQTKTSTQVKKSTPLKTVTQSKLQMYLSGSAMSSNRSGVQAVAHKCPSTNQQQEADTQFMPPQYHDANSNARNSSDTPRAAAKRNILYSIVDITSLSVTQFDRLQQHLLESPEVIFALIFSDGSTQLREATEKKRRHEQEGSRSPLAVKLTISYTASADLAASDRAEHSNSSASSGMALRFVSLPLQKRPSDAAHIFAWARQILEKIMTAANHKVCFNAQELIVTVMGAFNFPVQTVLEWHVLDAKVACWMLDPDRSPETFMDTIKFLKKDGLALRPKFLSPGISKKQTLCEDMQLLGPVMAKAADLLKEKNTWELFFKVEMKLVPILASMESRGIRIDIEKLTAFSKLLEEEMRIVESLAHKAAGHPFVLNSVAQLRRVLYDELKLDQKCSKALPRTQVGHMKSTAEKVLQLLQDHHPLPALVLEYRHLAKVKSTYIDGLLPHVEKGVVHTCWVHDGTATGRLTSINPNMQNIPKAEVALDRSESPEANIHPRDVFVSMPGWTFLSADFQSIELRLLAHLSNDVTLLKVLNDPRASDIFVKLTSEWLAIPADKVTSQDREKTKRLVYAVIYGVGSTRLAEVLHCSNEQAKEYLDSFLKKFPAIHHYTQQVIRQSRVDGRCRSMFGRVRLIHDIHAAMAGDRHHAERQSGNFVIQGSAADICKVAMVNLVQAMGKQADLHARLILQIHDELLLEVPDGELEATQVLVQQTLEDTDQLCSDFNVHLKVSLPVSMRYGKTWGSMKDINSPKDKNC